MRNALRFVLVLVAAFCAVGASSARAEEDAPRLVLCLAVAADDSPVFPLAEVPSNHREIVVSWRLREGETANKVTHVWTAVDVGAAAPAGTKIAKETLALNGARHGVMRFTLPRDLPVGSYRLDVDADGTAWPPLSFRVGPATKPAPLAAPADLLPLTPGRTWRYDLVIEAGPGATLTMPGTEKGADGRLRGTATYVAAAADDAGTRMEIRRGEELVNEEWWRLDASELAVTKERQEKETVVHDPPVPILRLPLDGPSKWEYASKDGALHRSARTWGPLPLPGAGDRSGYVVLASQPMGAGLLTIERWFVPGVGVVREVQVTSVLGRLAQRIEATLVAEETTHPEK